MKLPAFLSERLSERLGDRIGSDRFRRLRAIGWRLGFGFLVFLIAFYLSFPYDRVKDQLIAIAAQQNLDVEIAEAGPALGLGISFDDIAVATRPLDGSKPTRFRIPSATAKVSPLAQLLGEQAYDISADALGGEIDIDYRMAKPQSALKVEGRDLAMAEMPGVRESINLPLAGLLDLDVDITTPKHRNAEAIGKVNWKCAGCAIGDGKAKLKVAGNPLLAEGISLPRIRLGDFAGHIAFDKGLGKLQNVRGKSPDGELAIEGEIRLSDPVAYSQVDLYVMFKLSDALVKSSDKLQVILQFAGEAGKRPDGFYGFRLTGPLSRLGMPLWSKSSPFASGGGGARSGSAPRPAVGRPSPPTPSSDDERVIDPTSTPNANMPRYPTEPTGAGEPPPPAPPPMAPTP